MPVASPSARDRLLDAALASFAQRGALGATLDEIRRAAGVSVGALYHHFADRQALAGALYLRTLGDFQASFVEAVDAHVAPEAAVRAGVLHAIDWCVARPAEARLLFDGRGAADPDALRALNRGFFDHVRRAYAVHVHHGALRPYALALVAALWLGPTLDYLRHEPAAVDADTRAALADAAWRALREEPTT